MNIKDIVKSSPAFIIPAIINLLSLVIFTRLMNLEDYGQLSLAFVSVEFFQALFYQWIKLSMMRLFNKSSETPDSVVIGIQYCALITLILLLFLAVAFCLRDAVHINDMMFFTLIVLGIVGRGMSNFLLDYIRMANTHLKQYTLIALLANVFYYVPALVLIVINHNSKVNQLLVAQIIGLAIFLSYYYLYFFGKDNGYILKKQTKIQYIRFIKYGAPLILVYLASSMFIRVDRYVIESKIGLLQLGAYSAAFTLSNFAISSFFTILTLPTYPEIIRKMNNGQATEAKQIYDKNGDLILMIAIPILFLSLLFNQQLCYVFFGKLKGNLIAQIFPFVVFGTFLYNFKVHYFDQIFQFAKETKIYMIIGITVGVCHIICSYFLASILGTRGVALSGIAFNLIASIYIYIISKKFFKITLNKKLLVLTCILTVAISFFYFVKK